MTPSISVPTAGLCLKWVGERMNEAQQVNSPSQLLKCHKHHWRGDWLELSIPNQKIKKNSWHLPGCVNKSVVVVDIRSRRKIAIWILRARKRHWVGNLLVAGFTASRNPIHLELITGQRRIRSLTPGKKSFVSGSLASALVIDLKAILSSCV